MTEYLLRAKNEIRRLEPGARLSIGFDPGGRGDIRMSAVLVPKVADPKTGAPTSPQAPPPLQFKLELRAGSTTAATRVVTGTSGVLTHAVDLQATSGPGNWRYIVTNQGDRSADFTASVSFPTSIALRTADITLEAFHLLISGTIRALALHLESGAERCHVDVTSPYVRSVLTGLGAELPARFTLPELPMNARVHDIDAVSTELTLEPASPRHRNGSLHFVLRFEEQGHEITLGNVLGIDLSDIKLDVRLGLALRDGLVSWELVEVAFPADAEFSNVSGNLLWRRLLTPKIREAVEDGLGGLLRGRETRAALSGIISGLVRWLTGVPEDATLHAISVTAERLVVTYYQA